MRHRTSLLAMSLLFVFMSVRCGKTWHGRKFKGGEVRIESEKVQFHRIETLEAQAWRARALVNFSICLNWEDDPRAEPPSVRSVQLRVEGDGNDGQELQAKWKTLPLSEARCVGFDEALDFQFASPTPHFYKKVVRIRPTWSDRTLSSTVYIDPWQQTLVLNPQEEPDLHSRHRQPLRVRVDTLSFCRNSERTFKVDRSLALQFGYPLSIKLEPRLTRAQGLSPKGPEGASWEGARYNLRGVLSSTSGVLGEFETQLTANRDGNLVGRILVPIRFEDLPKLEGQTKLTIDLIPLSTQDDAPEGTSFVVAFDPNAREALQPAMPATETAAALLSSPKAANGNTGRTDEPEESLIKALITGGALKRFRVSQGEDINLKNGVKLDANATWGILFSKAMEPAWLQNFSYLYSRDPFLFPGLSDRESDFDRFQQHPESFVDWLRFTVVEVLDESSVQIASDDSLLDIGAGVFKEVRESNRNTEGKKTDSGIERGENRTVGVTAIGSGHSWFWNQEGGEKHYLEQESSNHRDRILQGGFRRSSRFHVNRTMAGLKGTFKRCMLLIFKPGRSWHSGSRFLFCGPADKGEQTESYFYVASERSESPQFVFGAKPGDPRFLRAFRGERNLVDFQKAIRDATLAMDVRPSAFWRKPSSDNEAFIDEYNAFSSFPGILHLEHFPETNVRAERLELLVNSLAKSLEGPVAAIHTSELLAYFSLIQSQPEDLLGSSEGRSRFGRIGELITARGARTCQHYIRILRELHLTLTSDEHVREAKWLYDLAAQLAPKCQSSSR
jgi:hypothetical protein